MNIQNLHTHTTYCDGVDTPEDMIIAALAKGFDSIGFSGHSFMDYSDYLGCDDKTVEYRKEILRFKKKYEDKIKIYLGLEGDMYYLPTCYILMLLLFLQAYLQMIWAVHL